MSQLSTGLKVVVARRLALAVLIATALAMALTAFGGSSGVGRLQRTATFFGGDGYWLVSSEGEVTRYGDAVSHGDLAGINLNAPIVGMAPTRRGGGYWMVGEDGGIFSFGDAKFFGSTGHMKLNLPVVGMAATPSSRGYWFVAGDGGIFSFGDAKFFGSTGDMVLNKPVVGMATTPTGNGYWLVATDGGIFSFGDAKFYGSTGDMVLNQPVVGMATTPSGKGYWLVAKDGGIFSFGDAKFYGSTGDMVLNKPVMGMDATPTGNGYWFSASDGGVFTFGDAKFHGSGANLGDKIVDLVASPRYRLNELPVAVEDNVSTAEDNAVSVDVLANDTGLGDEPLSVAVANAPAHGTASVQGTRILYSPAADYNGPDLFSYRLTDIDGESSTAALRITVTPVSDGPSLFTVQSAELDEDTPGSADFTVADLDNSEDELVITGRSSNPTLVPASGITFSGREARRQVIITPAPNQHGTTNVTIDVSDGTTTTSQTFPVTVNPVNDRPEISSISNQTIAEDGTLGPLAFTVTDADDPDAGLVVSAVSSNQTLLPNASVTFGAPSGSNRSLTATPAADKNGASTVTVTVSDGSLTQGEIFVLTVTPVNDAPVAGGASITTDEDAAQSGSVPGSDIDDVNLTYSLVDDAANGSVVVNPDGTFTYTPDADYNGPDSFTFKVTDDDAADSNTGTINVTVNQVNDLPTVGDTSVTTDEDEAVTDAVAAADIDGHTLAYSIATQGLQGSATIDSDGSFTYTPNGDANGSDVFTVQVDEGNGGTATADVTVTINPVNDAPVATDQDATTGEDGVLDGSVTATDVDGDTLTYSLVDDAANGSVVVNPDGTFTYTPDADYNGPDSFTFAANDGSLDSAPATVSVTVTAGNDLPTMTGADVTTDEDEAVDGSVTAADIDGDTLAYTIATQGLQGSATIDSDGSFTYTPNGDANGSDVFTVQVDDGNGGTATADVTVTINPVNDAPVATDQDATTGEDDVLAGSVAATDVDGDSLAYSLVDDAANGSVVVNSDGTFTYTPDADFNGPDSFTFKADDGTADSNTATVSITVDPVNDAPVADDGTATTNEDQAVPGTVSGSDPENDALTYSLVDDATNGTAVVNSDGTFTYTPDADYNGTDSFTFAANDGDLDSAPATVTVTISPVDDFPAAVNDTPTTDEDVAATIDVLANDTGLGDGGLVVTIISDPFAGTATVNPDNSVTYTPDPNWNGFDSFRYQVTDADGDVDNAWVDVEVNPVNDPPTISDIANQSTDEDTATSAIPFTVDDVEDFPALLDVTGTSSDQAIVPDGNIFFDLLPLSGNRSVVVIPADDAHGTVTITITVTDADGDTDEDTFQLTVNPIGDAPVAQNLSTSTNEDTVKNGTLPATDADGDALTWSMVDGADHGTAVVNSDGTYSYTPDADYNGFDSFTFKVNDGTSDSNTATVSMTVNSVNDLPTISDIADQTTDEDTATPAIPFTVGDVETGAGLLTVTGTSSDSAVVPNSGIVFGGSGNNRTVTVIPAANAHGAATITVKVADLSSGSSQDTFQLTVTSVNDAPVANDDEAIVIPFNQVDIDVVANDSDVDGDSLAVTVETNPSLGTVSCTPEGICTYTPQAGFIVIGSDTFTYKVTDPGGLTSIATVRITGGP
jgi:VCBS repeat-containing protein